MPPDLPAHDAYLRVPGLEAAGWPLRGDDTEEEYCARLNGTEIAWLVWSRTAPRRLIDAAWEELRIRDGGAPKDGRREFLDKLRAKLAQPGP